ncbi:SRPBCC family protein [Actinocorallia populi]|uniref:SRPBCC family protein n=1 Tax=Actinocorallia populi TaxID=2079200 RepID=UPI000D08F9CD|nr:SRPBCC family protein [Actinocorallia populi]
MKLQNTLDIPVPAEEAWKVLLDIERIAPCVPGATLTSHEGDRFGGKVKVKLGPIGLTYSGTVTFLSRDEAARTVVMEAGGRETRGGGTAKAVITCSLTDRGDTTGVLVETDLTITGRPAQFGRSTLADVAAALIDQFAANLAADLAGGPAAPAAATAGQAEPAAEPEARPAPGLPAEPVDLLGPVGGGLLRYAGPLAVASVLLVLLLALLRRRQTGGGSSNTEK